MRELEREPSSDISACTSVAIVGQGRLGYALAGALRDRGMTVSGPLGRHADGAGAEVVLLCVPDIEIAAAAAAVAPGPLVGHCSGATGLEVLQPHEGFSLHPLMTITADGGGFAGAGAAIAGTTPHALQFAASLAAVLEMRSVEVAPEDRPLYHAAASVASNFLITLEGAAEQLAAAAGVERSLLVPLVRASVENWARAGAAPSLTGPIARGDEVTVARQRQAVANAAPELLELFDALADATRVLAGRERQAA